MTREACIKRKTKETDINLTLVLDGQGKSNIKSGIAFFDHMLDLFTKHSLFDLDLKVIGDLDVDFHHTVEDTGICLGQAFRNALGNGKGITRFSCGIIPMDEALCQVALDISGRPYLEFDEDLESNSSAEFDLELLEEFLRAFITNAKITAHINMLKGKNTHHIIEACFKALGIVLARGIKIDPRKSDIPSTKGVI
jgi:imidazoleglycerol-phosphate dehydratase